MIMMLIIIVMMKMIIITIIINKIIIIDYCYNFQKINSKLTSQLQTSVFGEELSAYPRYRSPQEELHKWTKEVFDLYDQISSAKDICASIEIELQTKRMPLSGAERARRYRQRLKENEHDYTRYLQKERERYNKRKENGDIKLIASMSEREKRSTRRSWRTRKQKSRQKNQTDNTGTYTPPPTPTGPFPIRIVHPSRQRQRRDRARAYRAIEKLKQKLKKQETLLQRYKKRFYRQKQRQKDINSPRTKTNIILKGQKVNSQTRRSLLFHQVLLNGFRDKYQKAKSDRSKHLLSKAISSKLLKKYRLQQLAKKELLLTQRRLKQSKNEDLSYTRKSRKIDIVQQMKSEVEKFLRREDNSRMKAGKKSTKTKSKVKKQIYLLNDTLKNLHLKYLAEDKTRKMSYSLFCRFKPFYIRHATSSDRETCLCKRHENLQFKANKLRQLKLVSTADLDDLAAKITCHTGELQCMYRTCEVCKDRMIGFDILEPGTMVEWYEWRTKKVERESSHSTDIAPRTVSRTAKENVKGTIKQLTNEFHEELSKCCKHLYNIKHQFKAVRQLKEKLTSEDVLIHIDFSENLNCKYSSEIQSVHFGASQRQISLHTGVIYTSTNPTLPFCSISDNLKHSPCGIWGHMCPVLQFIKEKNNSVKNLYVLSDGPTTQYRCKENFFLLTKKPLEIGYKSVNWNFLEAGHGKGAPDGIGAVIKREADRAVLHGSDITGAESLYDTLTVKNIAVELFLIKDEDIKLPENDLQSTTISAVPGTMKIHQVYNKLKITIKLISNRKSNICAIILPSIRSNMHVI